MRVWRVVRVICRMQLLFVGMVNRIEGSSGRDRWWQVAKRAVAAVVPWRRVWYHVAEVRLSTEQRVFSLITQRRWRGRKDEGANIVLAIVFTMRKTVIGKKRKRKRRPITDSRRHCPFTSAKVYAGEEKNSITSIKAAWERRKKMSLYFIILISARWDESPKSDDKTCKKSMSWERAREETIALAGNEAKCWPEK